jgi:ubiquinone/menaquinone biosynthesis C-methylase UbiE
MTRDRRGWLAGIRGAVKRRMISGPGRDKWQYPDQVIATLAIQPGDRIADIGAGSGYFTTHLARASGPTGITYAIDSDDDMLDLIEQLAEASGLATIRPIRADPDGPTLPERVDLAFLCNVYHHLPDQRAYFARFAGQLAPGGRVAIIEAVPGGLAARLFGHVTPPERIQADLRAAGFELKLASDLPASDARQSFQIFVRAGSAAGGSS